MRDTVVFQPRPPVFCILQQQSHINSRMAFETSFSDGEDEGFEIRKCTPIANGEKIRQATKGQVRQVVAAFESGLVIDKEGEA
ncbi:unnamed protein product [Linum trigynum]|uniref:Uncharacterized protein n=1 Tax=Linum trigynum TaxID=586398 RepID=A0AAV2E6E2_9ROSI